MDGMLKCLRHSNVNYTQKLRQYLTAGLLKSLPFNRVCSQKSVLRIHLLMILALYWIMLKMLCSCLPVNDRFLCLLYCCFYKALQNFGVLKIMSTFYNLQPRVIDAFYAQCLPNSCNKCDLRLVIYVSRIINKIGGRNIVMESLHLSNF